MNFFFLFWIFLIFGFCIFFYRTVFLFCYLVNRRWGHFIKATKSTTKHIIGGCFFCILSGFLC